MIHFTTGNLFDSPADAIVNTVNLMGVMGKGIALQFKERFKNNFAVYRQACKDKRIGIGNLLVTAESLNGRDILVINFPTKTDWRRRSEYSYIELGLDNLIEIISDRKIRSIAMPPLGAGNGGLDWASVKEIIVGKLSDIDCDITIYEPGYTAESQTKEVRLTHARALLVCMLDKFQREGQEATAFAAVKAIYFLQKFGAADIFKMKFQAHTYGPYCDSVRHLLHSLDGAYIRGFADMSKRPFEPFDTVREKLPEVYKTIDSNTALSDIVSRTCNFLNGYWDDFSLELISSVDFLMEANPDDTADAIYSKLCAWSDRKRRLFADISHTVTAYNHVTAAKI